MESIARLRPCGMAPGPVRVIFPAVLPRRARLFSTLALLTVAAVQRRRACGASPPRAARCADEAARLFRVETETRARALEGLLAGTRADLAFLAGSPPGDADPGRRRADADPEQTARRDAAESALLLFLRAHPEVTRLAVRDAGGNAARPRWAAAAACPSCGWRRSPPAARGRPSPRTGRAWPPCCPSLRRRRSAADGAARARGGDRASLLLGAAEAPRGRRPRPIRPAGSPTARDASWPGARRRCEGPQFAAAAARAPPRAGRRPRPGGSQCAQSQAVATALVEPVAARYRTTLALNLGAMALAVLLGLLAVREVAQRERLEAQAREEARVRDLERQLFHAERLTTAGRLAAGHRPRDQQPAGGHGQLPEPGPRRPRARRRRVRAAAAGERAPGPGPRGPGGAPGAGPRRSGQGPAQRPSTSTASWPRSAEFVRSRPRVRAPSASRSRWPRRPWSWRAARSCSARWRSNLIVNACEAQPGREARCASARGAEGDACRGRGRGPRAGHPRRRPRAHLRAVLLDQELHRPRACRSATPSCGSTAGASKRCRATDGGTVFRMTLPAPPPGRRSHEPARRPAHRGRVLVVEDEGYVRESLTRDPARARLRGRWRPGTVAEAHGPARRGAGGRRAHRLPPARRGRPGARASRSRPSSPDVPVVVLTGQGTIASAVECLKSGASDYLLKPADPDALEVALDAGPGRPRPAARGALPARRRGAASASRSGAEPGLAARAGDDRRRRRHRFRRAAARRVGHGQGAARPPAPPEEPARRRALRPRQLRGRPPRDVGERVLRPPQGLVHRRQRGPRRAGSSSPHRGTLFLDEVGAMPRGGPGQAAARDPGRRVPPPGRRSSRRAWTCASWPPPTPTSRRTSRTGASAPTSTTASTCCRSAVPPLRERPEDIALLARSLRAPRWPARLGRPGAGPGRGDAGPPARLRLAGQRARAAQRRSSARSSCIPGAGLAALDLAPEPVAPRAAARPPRRRRPDDLTLRENLEPPRARR